VIKKIIAINFIILIIVLISLELITKIFKLSEIMGIDSNLIENVDGIRKFKKNSEGKVFGKIIYTDSYGFRVPDKNFNYSQNKSSIFFIGDSTTFGNGVKEENTFVGKLRAKKNEFNFFNSSVPGYQIYQHNKNIGLIKEFSNIEKIFYVFTLNDVYEKERISFDTQEKNTTGENQNFFDKLKNIKIFSFINLYFRNKSYLYMFVKGVASDPSKRYFQYAKKYYQNKGEFIETKNYLLKLKNATLDNDIDLTVVILPYEFQTRKNNCNEENLLPQTIIKNILISLEIKHKNYTTLFCNQKKPKTLFYKFDPMHLSKDGHNLVFLEILKEI